MNNVYDQDIEQKFTTFRGTLLQSLKKIVTGINLYSLGSGTERFMKGSYLIDI